MQKGRLALTQCRACGKLPAALLEIENEPAAASMAEWAVHMRGRTLKVCSTVAASAALSKCAKPKPRGCPVNLSVTSRTCRQRRTAVSGNLKRRISVFDADCAVPSVRAAA